MHDLRSRHGLLASEDMAVKDSADDIAGHQTPDELDIEAVRLGLMTEEDRIKAAYRRIHEDQMKRPTLSGSRR